MGDDDVAAAAEKHRKREAKKAAKQQLTDAERRDPNNERKQRQAMVEDALAGVGGERIELVAGGVVILAFGVLAALLDAKIGDWSFVISIPILIGALFLTYSSLERLVAARARRELRRIRGFESATYIERLSENRRNCVAVFTVRFAKPVPAERQHQIRDAIKEWMSDLENVQFSSETTLVARSASISCHQMLEGGTASGIQHEWTNRNLHSNVAHFIRRVLRRLKDVKGFAVEIEGTTRPWHEAP